MKLNGVLDYHMVMFILLGISHILLLCGQQKNSSDCCFESRVREMTINVRQKCVVYPP